MHCIIPPQIGTVTGNTRAGRISAKHVPQGACACLLYTSLVACVSAVAWLVAGRDFALTLLSTVFLYLALFYLSTALYRYPILVLNPSLPLTQVALCATGIALKNLGYVFLYWCVLLLALMICAVTGVGLVLLLPGASALLMATAWSESLKRDEYKRTNAA